MYLLKPANTSINTNKDFELCQYAHLKFLYANGNKREAILGLREFVNSNLMLKFNQCHQLQLQVTANLGQNMGAGPGLNAQQLPPAFHLNNLRDLQKRTHELETQLAKCYLKLGKWH